MKIKSWKVREINSKMSNYGDRFEVRVEGHEWGHSVTEYEDENGFVTVTNVWEVKKETEKAMLLNIDGFDAWVPKSAIA